MGSRSGDGVDAFVAARYLPLARTAYLVLGETEGATTAALEALDATVAEGARALREGTPTADSRRHLLTRLLEPEPSRGERPDLKAAPDLVAIDRAYAVLPTLGRVTLAVEHVEGIDAAGAAPAVGRSATEVAAAREAAVAALVEAARRARPAGPLDPPASEIAPVPATIAEALDRRLDLGAPALGALDPVAELRRTARTRRRRNRLVAIGSALGLVLAATLAVRVAADLPVAAPSTGPSGSAMQPPSGVGGVAALDPGVPLTAWRPRGALVGDRKVVSAAERDWPDGTRLLFAGRLGGGVMVLGWEPSPAPGMVRLQVRGGPGPAASVLKVPSDTAVVPLVGRARGGRTPLLVLTAPGVAAIEVSGHISFGRDGGPLRTFRTVAVRDGVAVTDVLGDRVPAVRVRVAGYDGPPLNGDDAPSGVASPACLQCSASRWADAVSGQTAARIADATGQAVRWVEVLPGFDGRLGPTAVSVAGVGRTVVDGDIACTAYRLPTGRMLTSTAVRARVDGRYVWWGGHLTVEPPGASSAPPCTQLVVKGPDGSRTYAVAAPGAAAMQLVMTSTRRHVAGDPTPTPAHTAVLTAPPTAPGQQVVLRTVDPAGQTLQMVSVDGPAEAGDPFDLRP